MLIALSISVVALLIVSLVTEKGKIKSGIKDAAKFGSISGIANGLLNFIVMISVNYLSASLVFPLISGLSLVWSFVFARVLFKEKYLNYQYIGFILSVASVVFMNL